MLAGGSFFIFIRMKIILLCIALIIAPCLAQEPVVTAPVDSAAYYQKMYEYNLEKYNTDTLTRDVMMWTFWGSMSVTMLALGYKMCSDISAGESKKFTIGQKFAIFVPFGIMTASGIGYITFEIAGAVRHSKYKKYYQKWEDYQKRNSVTSGESMQVGIAPLLNPLDGRYGAVLAFSF